MVHTCYPVKLYRPFHWRYCITTSFIELIMDPLDNPIEEPEKYTGEDVRRLKSHYRIWGISLMFFSVCLFSVLFIDPFYLTYSRKWDGSTLILIGFFIGIFISGLSLVNATRKHDQDWVKKVTKSLNLVIGVWSILSLIILIAIFFP